MNETDSIEAASRRLALALDALEAAAERQRAVDRAEAALSAQIHALGDDRVRLASDLDAALARSRTLETANREATACIAQVVEVIRTVLASEEQ